MEKSSFNHENTKVRKYENTKKIFTTKVTKITKKSMQKSLMAS